MKFVYDTGIRRTIFSNVRLRGSWDAAGRHSDEWSEIPMREVVGPDAARAFEADVEFAASEVGKEFSWTVVLDGPLGLDRIGMVTEHALGHDALHRTFKLGDSQAGEQRYYLTHVRRLGARKVRIANSHDYGFRFAVWAPNAQAVEVVFGDPAHGYIANDGTGIDASKPVIPLERDADGVWSSDPERNPALARYAELLGAPYMYRIRRDDGSVAYRTDLHSRGQCGSGDANPNGEPYTGQPCDLNGVVSCSLVIDTEMVESDVDNAGSKPLVSEDDFWRDEFSHGTPFPHRIDDMVIYELHVGSLGFGEDRPGNLDDAIALLDYLVALGVNAVELLPIAEASGTRTWGYGNSHHFAIESSAGGRDKFRHFVRECHRRGIAVIVDVVYNHYVANGERAQWQYDSVQPEKNIYYWYEGKASDYPTPEGGYLDNLSTGYAPRYHEEMVRKLFISSAVALVIDFHVDGFRVDQTTSIHAYNVVHADGRPAGNANLEGGKFLRELSRTLRLIKPTTLLTCEDHSEWVLVTEHPDGAGLGFDATWYSNFYHHLIGDTGRGPECANLLRTAGMGGDGPLALERFAGVLASSGRKTVVYHESHDEAGNSEHSGRTLMVAIAAGRGAAPPEGELRSIAEARCRFVAGITFLSAGTPMFLMGEEIGATKDFTYDGFLESREDLYGERAGRGRLLFRFYSDVIRLRRRHQALTTPNIEIVYAHNQDRLLAFRRWRGPEQYLVIATLSNAGFPEGYPLPVPEHISGDWRQLFTSDERVYGGDGVSNEQELQVVDGELKVKLPARGFVVLRHSPH